jgi:hypothetical protein
MKYMMFVVADSDARHPQANGGKLKLRAALQLAPAGQPEQRLLQRRLSEL